MLEYLNCEKCDHLIKAIWINQEGDCCKEYECPKCGHKHDSDSDYSVAIDLMIDNALYWQESINTFNVWR
jgi:uncharacterized paraquat-inducible protein A